MEGYMKNLRKEDIRKKLTEKRSKLSCDFISENSKLISEKLFDMQLYNESDNIYIYMNFGGEVSTKEIISDALSKGKKVAIPKIINNEMNFYYIKDIEDVEIGHFGVMEPITNEIAKDDKALVIMPGVAFDSEKNRIGHGKGFYDKYLDKNKSFDKIALAYDFQVMEKVPFENADVRPDIIITEKNLVR